jgi:hypothetical protein
LEIESHLDYPPSARKVAILLAIGDWEFTFGELSMKAGCHLANKNYRFLKVQFTKCYF